MNKMPNYEDTWDIILTELKKLVLEKWGMEFNFRCEDQEVGCPEEGIPLSSECYVVMENISFSDWFDNDLHEDIKEFSAFLYNEYECWRMPGDIRMKWDSSPSRKTEIMKNKERVVDGRYET